MPPPSDDRSRNHLSLSPASHVIVCGLGPLGEAVVRILASFGTTIVIAPKATSRRSRPRSLPLKEIRPPKQF